MFKYFAEKKKEKEERQRLFADLFLHPFALKNGQLIVVDMRDSSAQIKSVYDSAQIDKKYLEDM